MITFVVFFFLYSLFIFIFKKYNITGWKGRGYAFVVTFVLMLAAIPIMGIIGNSNHSEQIAATGTLDNRYFSITVPTDYKGEIMKQYEPASYSVALSKNNTVVLISVANYDIANKSIEDCLISFITTNPQIAGKLDEMPSFNECTILGQHAIETQFKLPDNNVNAIGFCAKNGMFYYSTAFNISLEEHKNILNTLNIKETKVEYIDTETFFRTCYHGLVFNLNQYIDESILLESYELNPQDKELYINIKLESISATDIDKGQLEAFKSEMIESFRQSSPIVSISEKEGYTVVCKVKYGM